MRINSIGCLDGEIKDKVNSTYGIGENSNRAFIDDFSLVCSLAETHQMYKYKMTVKDCCEFEYMMEENIDNVTQMWLDGVIW